MLLTDRIQRILYKSPEQIQELIRLIGFYRFLSVFGKHDYSAYLLYPHFTKDEIVEYVSRKLDLENLPDAALEKEIDQIEKTLEEIEEPPFHVFFRSINFESEGNLGRIETFFGSPLMSKIPQMRIIQIVTLLAAIAHCEGITSLHELRYPQTLPEIKKGIEALTNGSRLETIRNQISSELIGKPSEYRRIVKTGLLLIGQAFDEDTVYKSLYTIYRDLVLDISYLDNVDPFKA